MEHLQRAKFHGNIKSKIWLILELVFELISKAAATQNFKISEK
jgi:hypothetical protein